MIMSICWSEKNMYYSYPLSTAQRNRVTPGQGLDAIMSGLRAQNSVINVQDAFLVNALPSSQGALMLDG